MSVASVGHDCSAHQQLEHLSRSVVTERPRLDRMASLGWVPLLLAFVLYASHGQVHSTFALDAPVNSVWPKPLSFTSTQSTCTSTIWLGRVDPTITIERGNAKAAKTHILKSLKFAKRDWGCSTGSQPPKNPWAMFITVVDARCLTPGCYTQDTREGYTLEVTEQAITIRARTLVAVQWAFSSLASLSHNSCKLACLPIKVTDKPRFAHRGILLDTSRHWFSVRDIKRKIIDPMFASKMNVLHWHVSDAQSQPLEVKFNPALQQPYTAEQAYSQEDAARIIQYAWLRGIRVVPEFDMPGHTAVLYKAVPEAVSCYNKLPWDGTGWPNVFCNQPPCGQLRPDGKGQEVATQLVGEMVQLFPDKLFGTGADEVNFNCWAERVVDQSSPEYPAFKQESLEKLKAFQAAVAAKVQQEGKRLVVWDESFAQFGFSQTPALPQGSVLIAWQAPEQVPAMTDAGYYVIYAPYASWYLDCGIGNAEGASRSWCAPMKNWQVVYTADPLEQFTAGGPGKPERVLGGEVAMWTEHVVPSILEYVVWPRAAAAAERLWSPRETTQDVADAAARLAVFSELLTGRGLRLSPLDWQGDNFRYYLQTEWCDFQNYPVIDSQGSDYCEWYGAKERPADMPLTFDNLVIPPTP